MNINELSIKEALELLKSKRISCSELTKTCLERIKKIENKINAFITVDEEGALRGAKEHDRLISEKGGEAFQEKPLLGIPIGVKDIFSTKDLKTTAGAKIIEDYLPPYDATVVARLRRAGATIVGKTNLDAWAHGSSGENSQFGPTRNPYSLDRVAGGSSSGSAAALASSECLMTTGTDTGGSIRLPASFCNVVGIKPTYGKVSRYGIIAMASSFDSIGHFTKSVYDNALVLSITAGCDKYDATTVSYEVPNYTKNLNKGVKGMTIGIPKEYFIEGIDKEVENATQEAIKKLANMGAKIKNISLPHTSYAMACYYILVSSEVSSNLARFDGIRYGRERAIFGDEAKRRIMLGTYTLSSGYYDAYYLKAAKVRTLIKQDFEKAFKEVDVIIAPTSPTVAFKIGEKTSDPLKMYLSDILTCPVNIAGVPSLNVPAGFVDGLPTGIQIIGPQFSEELLYQVGYVFERETQYYKVKPKI